MRVPGSLGATSSAPLPAISWTRTSRYVRSRVQSKVALGCCSANLCLVPQLPNYCTYMANQGLSCALSSDYNELLVVCAVIDEPSSDEEQSKWLVHVCLT